MRQRTLLFKLLEVVKAMRAFITQQMDNSEELHSKLKLAENELATFQKTIDEGAKSLRKAEGEGEVVNAEAPRLRKEWEAVEA